VMDRRRFLLASLAGALAAPLGAGAQAEADRIGLKPIALRVAAAPGHLEGLQAGGPPPGFQIRSAGAPT
jgi:hypothetical protein